MLSLVSSCLAGDWPQWRGPDRTGKATDSPKLADHWGKEGPELVWKSDPIPSADMGGLGSPAVAEGKIVLYANPVENVPLTTRKVSEQVLRQLMWLPNDKENRPQPYWDAMEKARLSDGRAALTSPDAIFKFAKKWTDDNLTDKKLFDRYHDYMADRIRRGKDAFSYVDIDRLAEIKDKEFPNEQALVDWLKEKTFDDAFRKAVMDNVPKTWRRCADSVICLDAANGKQIWRKDYPGKDHYWGISVTPTIAGGKVYLIDSMQKARCFDLADGKLNWEKQILDPPGRLRVDSSFLLADGLLVVLADRLQALDAATGELKWKNEKVDCNDNSPVLWTNAGNKYVICNTGSGPLVCVELATGKLLWDTAGGGCSTAAIEGDTMAVLSGNPEVGLTAYKLAAPAKPISLWTVKGFTDRGASPLIHDGYVYAVGNGKAICVEIATGKTMWTGNVGGGEISSPILADNKIFCPVGDGRAMVMLQASPAKFHMLATAPMPVCRCTSPAFADGKLYVRLKECVACYDLTKEPAGK
jgi:outer membrane protein assembly factor BamB